MERRLWILLCVLTLSMVTTACQKIEEPSRGEIKPSDIQLSDTIPADFGRFVGVSSAGLDGTQMAFERADGAIVLVSLDRARESISDRVFIIRRK